MIRPTPRGPSTDAARRWLKRIAVGLLTFLFVAVICGTTFETVARRRLHAHPPVQGRLVDIGGRRLELDCRGTGAPLVVFESGLGSGARDWGGVHEAVALTTRACAYSRAGILASDPPVGPRDASAIADDLRALLAAAGERPPIVLVAHSLGGAYAMMYTQRFGADVAGLVLIDSSHPDMKRRMAAAGVHIRGPGRMLTIANLLARTGVLRLMAGSADAEATTLPTTMAAVLTEFEASDRALEQASLLHSFGDRSLFVLTAGRLDDGFLAEANLTAANADDYRRIWRELQTDLASKSMRGRHEVVANATHHIHRDQPDRVTEAVRWVVNEVRASGMP